MNAPASVRVDIWLWRARFAKTRSMAAALVERPAGLRFIDTGTRIVRQHGVALIG